MSITRLVVLTLVLCSRFTWVLGQEVRLTGQVQAHTARLPIAYVSIGIKGKNLGTITDEDGAFRLRVPAHLAGDTRTFSAIGYHVLTLLISHLTSNEVPVVVLTEKTTTLREVVIRGQAEKIRRIGTTTHNPFLWGRAQLRDSQDVEEFARHISLANTPSVLMQAHIFLRRPTVDTVRLRLNFYQAAPTGPAERLLERTILVRAAIRNGWLLTWHLTPWCCTRIFTSGLSFRPNGSTRYQLSVTARSLGGLVLYETVAWVRDRASRALRWPRT